ncbi:MAG: malto-oligosyltrehalose synthase [Planctomycetia bacterium]|nr:malto-oligosyltrehalose synthase [Planctomycetia bacterium]
MSKATADTVWDETLARIAQARVPEATYRLQFHHGFTLADATKWIGYLDALGVTDCYASPLLKAPEGSQSGYDTCDHARLNPELGGEPAFDHFAAELQTRGMGLLLDIVPNHMGIATNDNQWWMDVLENGRSSIYAHYFDIEWQPLKPDLSERILLPILGDQFGRVLEAGQLRLAYEDGNFFVWYYKRRFPIAPRTSLAVLEHGIAELQQRAGADNPNVMELQSIITGLGHLPARTESDPEKIAERYREREVLKRRLNTLTSVSPEIAAYVDESVTAFNGKAEDVRSFDLLERLLDEQAYRLAYWRVAADEINYRRFFDINELAAITPENSDVFEETHDLVLRLIDAGHVTGVRVDHPDGLFDPPDYFRRLQERRFLQIALRAYERLQENGTDGAGVPAAVAAHAGDGAAPVEGVAVAAAPPQPTWDAVLPLLRARYRLEIEPTAAVCPLFVVAEKILSRGETLPEDWPVHGTTGYDFMNMVNGLFVDAAQERALTSIYRRFTNARESFAELAYQTRKLTMQVSMSSELSMLGHQLDRLSEKNRYSRDFTLNSLTVALREIVACFPVYRTYVDCDSPTATVSDRDRHFIETAVARARRRNPAISRSIFEFIRDVLLLVPLESGAEQASAEQRHFVGRFQQFTSPVMAKGIEDTAFYRYNRLVSLNEVGGSPETFGVPVAAFHRYNQDRAARWPSALLATSTHDSKRSEDVRARIDVLSELPDQWKAALRRWSVINRRRKSEVDGEPAPDRNDEYLLYETLVGAWPLEATDGAGHAESVSRFRDYMIKAVREAKAHTNWINPHEEYEAAVIKFIDAILVDSPGNRFLEDLRRFARQTAHWGLLNGLAQTLLKLTCPGVPDIYQGTDLWDLSLVDPDNRRPVDFVRRAALLDELTRRCKDLGDDLRPLAQDLLQNKQDGRIKLYVLWRALQARRSHPGLFRDGAYKPVEVTGARHEHLCAFARYAADSIYLTVAPRLFTRLCSQETLPIGPAWEETALVLRSGDFDAELAPGRARRWRNVFTGELVAVREEGAEPRLALAEILATFPVALLEALPAG